MRAAIPLGVLIATIGTATSVQAEPLENVRLDVGATFSRIEQQIKTEVGAVRGERLVEATEVGVDLIATYDIRDSIAAGLFGQVDFGTRRAGRFDGFDDGGAATIMSRSGGPYQELWLGPIVRAQHRAFFAEVGHGLLTFRSDDGRDDIASVSGDTSSAFRTLPTVSWRMAIGGNLPISEAFDISARLIWRIRYYDRRGGDALSNDAVHGTQTYQPFIGIVYRPSRKRPTN